MADRDFPDPPVLEREPRYRAIVNSRTLPRTSLARLVLVLYVHITERCSRQSGPGVDLPYRDLWALYADLYFVADGARGYESEIWQGLSWRIVTRSPVQPPTGPNNQIWDTHAVGKDVLTLVLDAVRSGLRSDPVYEFFLECIDVQVLSVDLQRVEPPLRQGLVSPPPEIGVPLPLTSVPPTVVMPAAQPPPSSHPQRTLAVNAPGHDPTQAILRRALQHRGRGLSYRGPWQANQSRLNQEVIFSDPIEGDPEEEA
jgi:hypothetical protein